MQQHCRVMSPLQPTESTPSLKSAFPHSIPDIVGTGVSLLTGPIISQKIHQVKLQTLRPFRVGTLHPGFRQHPGFRHCPAFRQYPGCKQDCGLDNILGLGNFLHSVQLGVYKLYWM